MIQAQIKVVRGSCEGQIISILPGEVVSIGRSRHSNNRIVASELDVSARHCMVRMDADGALWLEVLSDKVTELDGQPLKSGDKIPLKSGQAVKLGNSVSFVMESYGDDDMATTVDPSSAGSGAGSGDDDMPTSALLSPAASSVSDDDLPTSVLFSPSRGKSDAVAPAADKPASGDNPDDARNKTATEFETRYASFDELEKVKKKYQLKRQMKAVFIGLAVLFFLGMSCASYFLLRPDDDSTVAWPDNLDNPKAKSAIVFKENIAIVFPSTLRYKETADSVEVHTAFGAKRNIPVHILARAWNDPDGLHVGRKEAFRQFRMKMEETESMEFKGFQNEDNPDNQDLHLLFVNKPTQTGGNRNSAGVPLSFAPFTRKVGNDDFFGYLIFFRYQDLNVSYLVEVPSSMEEKTSQFLKDMLEYMFLVSNPITVTHWEGALNYRKETGIEEDLNDAKQALKETQSSWPRAYRYILSALIKSYEANDQDNLKNAANDLETLRTKQAMWFSGKEMEYKNAAKDKRLSHRMEEIQLECDSVFPNSVEYTDYRRELISRKGWK